MFQIINMLPFVTTQTVHLLRVVHLRRDRRLFPRQGGFKEVVRSNKCKIIGHLTSDTQRLCVARFAPSGVVIHDSRKGAGEVARASVGVLLRPDTVKKSPPFRKWVPDF